MSKTNRFEAAYQAKLRTADEAVKVVESGNRVHYGLGLGAVNDLDKALAKRMDELEDIDIAYTVAIRKDFFEVYKATKDPNKARFSSAHFNGFDRKMAKEGVASYISMNFNELPSYWPNNGNNPDVAMMQVCPMDEHGNFNLGPQVSDIWGVINGSKKVILEVNENMPRALGIHNTINISNVDFVIEGSNPELTEVPSGEPTEIDKKIASHVVNKIRDNSTLQLGIGALPSTIGSLLAESDVKDLSCHTEMLVDGYLKLYDAGKLTNRKKVNHGKMVYAFAGGSQDLYDFIDNNPVCHVAPVDYVNNQGAIAAMDNFVSVNSCINVDLFGQVCSEAVGGNQISGTGGQLDFVQGAYHSEGGQSFICVASTRTLSDGTKESLIVPTMPVGNIITTPRSCTHWIVTEHGSYNVKGKSVWERAEGLIGIADPQFHDELIKKADELGIWRRTNKLR